MAKKSSFRVWAKVYLWSTTGGGDMLIGMPMANGETITKETCLINQVVLELVPTNMPVEMLVVEKSN